jgi:hypothetical protein
MEHRTKERRKEILDTMGTIRYQVGKHDRRAKQRRNVLIAEVDKIMEGVN